MSARRYRPGRAARGAAVLLLLAFVTAGCARQGENEAHDGHDEEHAHDEATGPHGGRLFEDRGIALELAIEEEGIPPEFRAYLYDDHGRPLPLGDARVSVVLERFGGRRDSLSFRADGDRLRSVRAVDEPHSFTAHVVLERGAARHTWTYTQHEGRVTLAPESVASAEIEVDVVGPREIEVHVEAPGEVRLDAERVVQVRPRFAGAVRALQKRLGDAVKSGERIATVHSNESLADYDIHAPMRGTVVARDGAVGQTVDPASVLYTIADLSRVWVDFALYPQIAPRVRHGQSVRVRAEAGQPVEAAGAIGYVGPLLEQDTRVSYGRVVLPNPRGLWKPGLYVTVVVTVDRARVAAAVPEEAIVRTARGPAVFRADGSTFELQPVETRRTDGVWTEIVSGLEPGARVVVRNAYLLKAELGKSEATHEH